MENPGMHDAGMSSLQDLDGRLSVEECSETDADDWNTAAEFLGGSLYHLWQWREINRHALGHEPVFLAARRDGLIVGLLPLVRVEHKVFGRILCSMPFVNYGGACAIDDGTGEALVRSAMRAALEQRADYLELRCTSPLNVGLPVAKHKISMTIALPADPETLWNGFTHKHRKNVRRAYKNGLSVVSGGLDQLDVFYDIMEEAWHEHGTPLYSRSYFECVLTQLADRARIFICLHRGQPVAAALTGYFNGIVEGLWAGSLHSARELNANYVLYWEMIRDACWRGCRAFHLGRSTAHSGSEEFKSRWNADAAQLYWYYFRPAGGAMPQLNVTNPNYQLAIRMWRHVPLWCTRRVGPFLARGIP
jgi:FemAB-related protein (PEP-CTERM system-associated)